MLACGVDLFRERLALVFEAFGGATGFCLRSGDLLDAAMALIKLKPVAIDAAAQLLGFRLDAAQLGLCGMQPLNPRCRPYAHRRQLFATLLAVRPPFGA